MSAYVSELRQRYPILEHQNALGVSVLVFAMVGMLASSVLYMRGSIAWWACLLLNAFFASLTHELEHDLIHNLYFRKQRVRHHLMLALTWLCRPTAVNPWVRRGVHIHHHKHSGTESDMEERTLSSGTPWGLARFLMVGDLMIASAILIARAKNWGERRTMMSLGFAAYFPVTMLAWSTWHLFLAFHASNAVAGLVGHDIAWSHEVLSAMHVVDIATVVLIAPNVFRTFCLNFLTSNLHYYGDIEADNLVQQTQVLNRWWLWPMQAFAFNFGSTHAIHHFVVQEPFYIRQLSEQRAHEVMEQVGVRFNDYGSLRRANRWTTAQPAS